MMTEAKKSKYSDQWFRSEANSLKLSPGQDLSDRILSKSNLPKPAFSFGRKIWAIAAIGLLAIVSLSVIGIATQESPASLIVELSSTTQDEYFKSYSDFLKSGQYVQLEKAYTNVSD